MGSARRTGALRCRSPPEPADFQPFNHRATRQAIQKQIPVSPAIVFHMVLPLRQV